MLVYLNGKYVNGDRANISINNRSFRYGEGCFETIKFMNGKVLLPHLHMERLFASMQLLQFDCPSYFNPAYIIHRIEELAAKNQHQELARIRLTVFRGDGGLFDPVNMRPNLLIQSWPLSPENNRLNENGLVVDVYKKGHKACDEFSNLKSNNFLLYAMAALHAKAQHCNDMLVMNQYGRIADATIANVWIVEGDTLITPPLTEAPVNGNIRRWILQQATANGFITREEPITIERLLDSNEVLLTNAIYGLKWVKQFGNKRYQCRLGAAIHQQLLLPLWV